LWITRKQVKHNVEVYINNAKILLEQSNFQSKLKVNGDTMTQASKRSRERERERERERGRNFAASSLAIALDNVHPRNFAISLALVNRNPVSRSGDIANLVDVDIAKY
jgi:hypothetical protein